ncbi:MAG: hypothetical protein KatS3mg075_898 [Meiothermus sp.]|jgi:hypothetical protein|nr:MAG: hypothetical protein KatS3mg075_898 [Meiothermus sp.]
MIINPEFITTTANDYLDQLRREAEIQQALNKQEVATPTFKPTHLTARIGYIPFSLRLKNHRNQ